MVALKELIGSISTDISPVLKGKVKELYLAIKHKQIQGDQDGADLLFPQQKHQYQYFNKAKNDLRRILQAYLLVLPSNNATGDSAKVYAECYRALAEIKILIRKGISNEAANLARKVLKIAIQYDLHQVAFMLAEELQYYSAFFERKLSESEVYDRIAKEQLKCIHVENKVRAYYSMNAATLNYSRNMSDEFRSVLDQKCKELTNYLKLNSSKINLFIYSIFITRHYAFYDYPKVVEVCQQANTFFLTSPNASRRYSFLYKMVPALMALNRYDEARDSIQRAIDLSVKGTANWSICYYYRLVLCFHEQKYQEAYILYQAVKKDGKKMYKSLGEDWLILKAYLSFFFKTGHIESEIQEYFKLSKFLNELPIASQDKEGNNINVMIVQILHMITNRKGKLIDSVEAFEKYIRRHLKSKSSFRAKIFLTMLLRIPRNRFHKVAVIRNTTKLVQQLAETPSRMGQNLEIEIVPYEVLWQEVLLLLDNKFARSRPKAKAE